MNVFLYAWAVFVYVLSSIRKRFSDFIWLSIWTVTFGIRWKWIWLTDFPITGSFTSPSLRSKLTSLYFLWSFFARTSTNLCISRSSAWVSVIKRFTCLLGMISMWCFIYGARAGITKKYFPSCNIFSGFSWQNGQWCVFSNCFTIVIYFIVWWSIKKRLYTIHRLFSKSRNTSLYSCLLLLTSSV